MPEPYIFVDSLSSCRVHPIEGVDCKRTTETNTVFIDAVLDPLVFRLIALRLCEAVSFVAQRRQVAIEKLTYPMHLPPHSIMKLESCRRSHPLSLH